MQKGIHPDWHDQCKVTCSCGNEFIIGSIHPTLEVDICNQCHPFFTGEVKFIDRQGRVDKFKKKMQAAQPQKTKKKAGQQDDDQQEEPKSYRELLREQKARLRQEEKSN